MSRANAKQPLSRWRLIVAGVLGVAAIGGGIFTVHTYLSELNSPRDMNGRPVVLAQLPPKILRAQAAVSSVGVTLHVPSVGLDVPVGALNEVGGVIDPPGVASAYLVRNYGAGIGSADKGTVYVVMHSCHGGAVCPGNYLIDAPHGRASVTRGADVYLGGLHYRVTGWQKIYKPDIRTDTAVWDASVRGRLVLFTCLQIPNQAVSDDNMVIAAQLVN